jgi:NADPH:quinone reductase-like Zn-dependent oxidoreductase
MKAFKQPLVLEESPLPPTAESGTAIVRTLSSPINDHTKAHISGQGVLTIPEPFYPGASSIARVLAVGPDAVALRPGQLVFVHGLGTARDDAENTQVLLSLHRGNALGTERAGKLFDQTKGYWRDVGSVPLENCIALDEKRLIDELGYTFADLTYFNRLSVAYGSIGAAKLVPGETLVVAPATGVYSGAVAEVAAQLGVRVIALTRAASKLKPLTSRHSNITPVELTGDQEADVAAIRALLPFGRLGADVFIDVSPGAATQNPHHFNVGLEVLRPGARAVLSGSLFTAPLPYFSMMLRNITITGKFMFTREEVVLIARLVEAGTVKLGKQAGHEVGGEFKFEEWEKALDVAQEFTGWGKHVTFTP